MCYRAFLREPYSWKNRSRGLVDIGIHDYREHNAFGCHYSASACLCVTTYKISETRQVYLYVEIYVSYFPKRIWNGLGTNRSQLSEQGIKEYRMSSLYKYRYKQARLLNEMQDNCSIWNAKLQSGLSYFAYAKVAQNGGSPGS